MEHFNCKCSISKKRYSLFSSLEKQKLLASNQYQALCARRKSEIQNLAVQNGQNITSQNGAGPAMAVQIASAQSMKKHIVLL